MAKWKTKAYKKKSLRERQRLEGAKGSVEAFGKLPSGRGRIALDIAVDGFIRVSSCRHGQPLGNPCPDFEPSADGACKRDTRICDLLTEKGERYMREYE